MRRGSLGIGLALCVVGVAIAIAPNTATMFGWLARWWPVAPMLLGVGSLIGFATRRQPRSPFRGAALLVVGGVALALTLQSSVNPVMLYGRFWPLLLGVVALVSILRYYTHKPELGESRPAFFSAGKLSLVGLIVVSGIAANRLAEANPNMLARISMPAGLDRLRDNLFGEEFTFDPISQTTALPAGGVVSVTNRYGDIAIEAADGDQVEVTLTPIVHAYDREAAGRVASQLQLAVKATGPMLEVSTNRNEIDHEITTNMRVRVPRSASLKISQAHGELVVAGVGADAATLAIDATHTPVRLRNVRAAVEVKNAYDTVEVTQSSGSLNILGRNDVVVDQFEGAVRLEDSDTVKLKGLVAPTVDLVSVDRASVSIEDVGISRDANAPSPGTRVTIEGDHTSVVLKSIRGNVSVKTSHEDVKASDVTGLFEVESSHSRVEATAVGALKIKTDHDDVRAKSIRGSVDIENDHGAVFVSGFEADCAVQTSFDEVRLEAARNQAGDVNVTNEHGEIDVRLPTEQAYRIEPTIERGDLRIDPQFEKAASVAATSHRVVLRTTFDDIIVKPLTGRGDDRDPA